MGELSHIKDGVKSLQKRLKQQQVTHTINKEDIDSALSKQVEKSSAVLGDRIEGALHRLTEKSTKETSQSLSKDIKEVVNLLKQSHQITIEGLRGLFAQQAQDQQQVRASIESIEKSSQGRTQELSSGIANRLEQIAIDMGTIPRTTPDFPAFPESETVNLDPLTDLVLQVLSKIQTVPKAREVELSFERNVFTDLIESPIVAREISGKA